jgi:hypothetical protein
MVCLAAILAIITINCGWTTTPSDKLIGVWKASDVRYSDTFFEIDKKEITFHSKEGTSSRCPILKIKKKAMQDGEWIQYTIFYRNRDFQKVEFLFYLHPSEDAVIRFKNQPYLVWKKDFGIET